METDQEGEHGLLAVLNRLQRRSRSDATSDADDELRLRALTLLAERSRHTYGGTLMGGPASPYDWFPDVVVEQRTAGPAAVLPIRGDETVGYVTTLLKTTILYSETVVLTLNGDLRVIPSRGGTGISLIASPDQLATPLSQSLIMYNTAYSQLVRRNRLLFLPATVSGSNEERGNFYSAHYAYSGSPVDPCQPDLPLNLRNLAPARSAVDSFLVFDRLLLPTFPQATLEDVARIATQETDSFIVFSQYLSQRLRLIPEATGRADVQDILDEIQAGVLQLNMQAKKLAGSRLLRGAEMGVASVSLAAAVGVNADSAQVIAGIVGSSGLLQVLRSHDAARRDKLDLKASNFYIPYLLSKA